MKESKLTEAQILISTGYELRRNREAIVAAACRNGGG